MMFKTNFVKIIALLIVSSMLYSFKGADTTGHLFLLVGTYTKSDSKGIYLYRMDTVTGALTFVSNAPFTQNPSYLAVHPNGKWVYAVNETSKGEITAFSLNKSTGVFQKLNSVSSHGNSPCHISIDSSGKFIFIANYGSGNIASFLINANGSIGNVSDVHQHTGKGVTPRQQGPHAHQILPGLGNFIYSNDLGTDKVYLYTFDTITAKFSLQKEISTQPGAGPRHLTIHKNQKWVYVVNELNGTIEAFNLNPVTGDLSWLQTISTLPDEQKSAFAGCADIHIVPSGKYLYASNRAEINNIAMYSIDNNGKLSLIGHQSTNGESPRNFAIDPSGKFLLVANQKTGNIVTFRIEPNGTLTETGLEMLVPMPVCLQFF